MSKGIKYGTPEWNTWLEEQIAIAQDPDWYEED